VLGTHFAGTSAGYVIAGESGWRFQPAEAESQ
jgi:hypothetical protein